MPLIASEKENRLRQLGKMRAAFWKCLCWHLWSIQARGYVCEVEMPNEQGQRRTIPGTEQRVHHSTEANPAQPRHSACHGKEKACWDDNLRRYSLSLRENALQEVFVQSLQTDTVLHTHLSGRIQARQTKRQQLDYSSNIITPIRSSHCHSYFYRVTKHSSVVTAPYIFSENISVRPNHY